MGGSRYYPLFDVYALWVMCHEPFTLNPLVWRGYSARYYRNGLRQGESAWTHRGAALRGPASWQLAPRPEFDQLVGRTTEQRCLDWQR